MTRRLYIVGAATLGGAAIGAFMARYLPYVLRGGRFQTTQGNAAWYAPDNALLAHSPFFLACLAGWAVRSVYWEAAARNAAHTKSSEARSSRGLHVLLANFALLIEIIPIRGFGRFLPASPLIMVAGLAVQAAGIVLAIWARRHLGRNWSGAIAIKVEHQLVRSGPYRLLRHPIYTGLLAMYVGPAIVTGEWHALIGVAMGGFAYWRKIRLEEAALQRAFGADYDAYRSTTWALVPGLF